MRELAADGIAVSVSCRVLELCRQQYYRWLAAPVTASEWDTAHLAHAVLAAHDEDPQYGYRFLVDEVRAAGFTTSERTVWKICSTNRWWSSFGKKRGRHGKKTGPPVHDDRLNRVFLAGRANQIWLTDITEHPTAEGKVYLCAVKDTWSNRIVGYSISDRMTSQLAVQALENAVARRGDVTGCIIDSDRGSQFRSRSFVAAIERHGLVGSMGRVGAAGDNAAMESFFALLQKNVLNTHRWATRHDLRIAIVTWIERTYHRRRRQPVLARLTPIEYETIMNQTVALTA